MFRCTVLQKNIQLERENGKVGKQFNDLKVQQAALKDQLQGLMDKFQREVEEGQTIHNIQEQQKKIINEYVHAKTYQSTCIWKMCFFFIVFICSA